ASNYTPAPVTILLNSSSGNGGDFMASVGGNLKAGWSVQSNGQNGGTVFIRGSGNVTLDGNYQANGNYLGGGNVVMSSYGNLTVNGYVQAQGGINGTGGSIVMESAKNGIFVTQETSGVSPQNTLEPAGISLDVSGTVGGGDITMMASNGITVIGAVNL